jgi:hypothetical protein
MATAATASRVLAATRLLLVAACAVLVGGAEAEPWRVHGGGGGMCFTRLFSFGDSITDNGNWMHYARSPGAVARPPYGETFFRRPNGRFCDGRIIIDHIGTCTRLPVPTHAADDRGVYIRADLHRCWCHAHACTYVVGAADALGIPFLTPYLADNKSGDFAHGANFAVGGATALGRGYFRRKKLDARFTPYSLRWQMRWLKKVLVMVSPEQGTEWSDLMASSLFLLGEIGGNDYNQALFQGRSVDEVKTYVPDVVAGISAALTVRPRSSSPARNKSLTDIN